MCMCVYIYIYTHTYTHILPLPSDSMLGPEAASITACFALQEGGFETVALKLLSAAHPRAPEVEIALHTQIATRKMYVEKTVVV